jgi:hypothetical protein
MAKRKEYSDRIRQKALKPKKKNPVPSEEKQPAKTNTLVTKLPIINSETNDYRVRV